MSSKLKMDYEGGFAGWLRGRKNRLWLHIEFKKHQCHLCHHILLCLIKANLDFRLAKLHLAERMGFEPMMSYKPIHAFQACSFDRSDTSPE